MNLKNYNMYLKNLIYWNKMFQKIFNNTNRKNINKHNKRLLNIFRNLKKNIKNNKELKKNYNYILLDMIEKYNSF